jgi:hypothetical protein
MYTFTIYNLLWKFIPNYWQLLVGMVLEWRSSDVARSEGPAKERQVWRARQSRKPVQLADVIMSVYFKLDLLQSTISVMFSAWWLLLIAYRIVSLFSVKLMPSEPITGRQLHLDSRTFVLSRHRLAWAANWAATTAFRPLLLLSNHSLGALALSYWSTYWLLDLLTLTARRRADVAGASTGIRAMEAFKA